MQHPVKIDAELHPTPHKFPHLAIFDSGRDDTESVTSAVGSGHARQHADRFSWHQGTHTLDFALPTSLDQIKTDVSFVAVRTSPDSPIVAQW